MILAIIHNCQAFIRVYRFPFKRTNQDKSVLFKFDASYLVDGVPHQFSGRPQEIAISSTDL